MSRVMLHGVLNMPTEMWHKDSPIDDIQRQARYVEASKLIFKQDDKVAELEKELSRIVSGLFSENELAILKLEQQANGAIKLTNVAMKKLQSPKCSQSRLEYFKAGVRALAFAIDKESKALKETV
jgi:hypothetical protein